MGIGVTQVDYLPVCWQPVDCEICPVCLSHFVEVCRCEVGIARCVLIATVLPAGQAAPARDVTFVEQVLAARATAELFTQLLVSVEGRLCEHDGTRSVLLLFEFLVAEHSVAFRCERKSNNIVHDLEERIIDLFCFEQALDRHLVELEEKCANRVLEVDCEDGRADTVGPELPIETIKQVLDHIDLIFLKRREGARWLLEDLREVQLIDQSYSKCICHIVEENLLHVTGDQLSIVLIIHCQ